MATERGRSYGPVNRSLVNRCPVALLVDRRASLQRISGSGIERFSCFAGSL